MSYNQTLWIDHLIVGAACLPCSGYVAAVGDRRAATATFLVTVLDTAAETTAALFLSEWSAAMAVRDSKRMSLLQGKQMTRMFAWLRPNDFVWN